MHDRHADRERRLRTSRHTSRNTIQMTAAAPRAQRHADADFARPARHRIRHRRVEADAGDHQGEDGERGAEPGEDDLLIDRLIDVGGLRLHVRHRHARIGLTHDLTDRGGVTQRIAVGAQRICHLPQLRRRKLRVRHVDDRRHLTLERAVAGVRGDADDLASRSACRRPSCCRRSRSAARSGPSSPKLVLAKRSLTTATGCVP